MNDSANNEKSYEKQPISPDDKSFVQNYFKELLFDEAVKEAIENLDAWNKEWILSSNNSTPHEIYQAWSMGWSSTSKEYWPAMALGKTIGYLDGWGEEWGTYSASLKNLLELYEKNYQSESFSVQSQFLSPTRKKLRSLLVIAMSYIMDKNKDKNNPTDP